MAEEEKEEKEKTRRIRDSDWKLVESHIKNVLDERKRSDFRRYHEDIWKEVDRQIAMRPMTRINRDQSEDDGGWHNVFELGELARASELASSDIRRIVFPNLWFDTHTELKPELNPQTGKAYVDPRKQSFADSLLRGLMSQQHIDFGFKSRFDLSVKEALHHGSYVAEIKAETVKMVYEGTKVKDITAPVWVPHSMWNCYPDPSPSIVGTNMYYNGSMIIESYIPRHKLKEMMNGDGWMKDRFKKINKEEHRDKENRIKDVKLTTFWGDVVIPRSSGDDMEFPNHKVILANGTLVYFAPFELPYPELIYSGYEKMDVRDPYYISPIIKMSPLHKMATILSNRYIDCIELDIEKPIAYDGNDADLVAQGGPPIFPGAKVAAKTGYQMKQLETGDPAAALDGLKMTLGYIEEHLGRPGAELGDRATAAEVTKNQQDSEVGLVNFIDKLEANLRSFLYMQHEINKREMDSYSYYSAEKGTPDFVRVSRKDLPESVHFEVVGSRGVLGEQQRSQGMAAVTTFAAKTPPYNILLKPQEILMQMFQDVGVKHPEKFVKSVEELGLPPEVAQKMMQMQMMLRQVMTAYQNEKKGNDVKREKMHLDHSAKMYKIIADLEKHITGLAHNKEMNANDFIKMLAESAINSTQEGEAEKQETAQVVQQAASMMQPNGQQSLQSPNQVVPR